MEINSNLLTTTKNSRTAKQMATPAVSDSPGAATYASILAQSTATQGDIVTLSGEAIMLSRLYGGSKKEIPATPLVGSKKIGAADPVMWLNADDPEPKSYTQISEMPRSHSGLPETKNPRQR
ncbi:hypothetical protein [Burkholderia paludis]|uniref:hypothetical protein n=1 Tax=Burkholderia paludis TaxID=1506587 RepID=UPI001F38A244|nr:hypothetical protein [Burkholderia paludis]